MTIPSTHLSVRIDRSVPDVCTFVADPAHLPLWAAGLGGNVVQDDGAWFVETPAGRARITFAPANQYGVLDHEVVTPAGETVRVPMRALADGDGSEVVFTVRGAPGASQADFERDVAAVTADLARLKEHLEKTA